MSIPADKTNIEKKKWVRLCLKKIVKNEMNNIHLKIVKMQD